MNRFSSCADYGAPDSRDQQMRKPISKRLRFKILSRDGYRCVYCGATAQEKRLEIDHIIPVSLGGENYSTNLAAACQDCNQGKSNIAKWFYMVEYEVCVTSIIRDESGITARWKCSATRNNNGKIPRRHISEVPPSCVRSSLEKFYHKPVEFKDSFSHWAELFGNDALSVHDPGEGINSLLISGFSTDGVDWYKEVSFSELFAALTTDHILVACDMRNHMGELDHV